MVEVDTLPALIEFLNDPDPDLRIQAALALGEQRDLEAAPALLAALNDENLKCPLFMRSKRSANLVV
jgi:HEAT repeat protein